MNTTTGTAEMDTLCQELYHQAEWFINAEGEIDGNHYAHVLKPHGTVTIKGIGEAYSGVYYVTHVTHTFRATWLYAVLSCQTERGACHRNRGICRPCGAPQSVPLVLRPHMPRQFGAGETVF